MKEKKLMLLAFLFLMLTIAAMTMGQNQRSVQSLCCMGNPPPACPPYCPGPVDPPSVR